MTKESIIKSSNLIKNKLLSLLIQEMLTPLTSVMGMASVLHQEIYGSLTDKQRKYVEVIHERSQYLRLLVEEIIGLTKLDESGQTSEKTPVDVKNICQQIVRDLEPEIVHQQIKVQLLAGSSDQVCFFDKIALEQTLYNLIYSVIKSTGSGSGVKIHLSEKQEEFNIAVWVSHPILGDNLPHAQLYSHKLSEIENQDNQSSLMLNRLQLTFDELTTIVFDKTSIQGENIAAEPTRELLALLLSCQLAEQNGGSFWVQGSTELGYRYILTLPLSK
ncbi:MAG: HAMP domain-containing histidine kinase [Okeania sp. SIO2H7]|uniref:sensor histidine kinase n=1 Tax=unclassified Okeania TaxID=2634635 RepID=UPI0013BFF2E8|nr:MULTISPECIES: HAMP domain-containing sensor histidine kinase [unclassified Okeania]NEP38877.1 HAMP domain-containing histidine kinase [Okeania sp. SIO2H7]NEP71237.1 HAMP domain-containing histidine kinase [Okeania sp. SIO2G5]